MKPIAWIHEWIILADGRMVGCISGHPRQYDFKARYQVTSPIIRAPGLGLMETHNTLYILGRARKDYLNPEVVRTTAS